MLLGALSDEMIHASVGCIHLTIGAQQTKSADSSQVVNDDVSFASIWTTAALADGMSML